MEQTGVPPSHSHTSPVDETGVTLSLLLDETALPPLAEKGYPYYPIR